MDAGRLDRKLRFERRQDVNDGAGNTVSSWVPQFEQAASRLFMRGGESVTAARLENSQPVILAVRNSANARQVTNDWRAVDTRDGRVYNIREIPRESDDRAMLEMMALAGLDR